MGIGRARELAAQSTTAAFATAVHAVCDPVRCAVGDTARVTRRRIAATAAVLAALVGEWLGHSIAYFRVGGVAGLQAGLAGGLHAYMLPLGAVLLVPAAAGVAAWSRAWVALGRRIERGAAALAALRGGFFTAEPPSGARGPRPRRQPALVGSVAAFALPMAAMQCLLFVAQENLERSLHGMPAVGLAPLIDGFGAAAWIQGLMAIVLAAVLVLAMRLHHSREATVRRWARMAQSMWHRLRRDPSPAQTTQPHVVPALLVLGSALWQRPPPSAAAF
jgi:hypothetical protein